MQESAPEPDEVVQATSEAREYVKEIARLMHEEKPLSASSLCFHIGTLTAIILDLVNQLEAQVPMRRSAETILDEVARLRADRRALAERVRDFVREECANRARDVGQKRLQEGHEHEAYGAGLAASAIRAHDIPVGFLLEG